MNVGIDFSNIVEVSMWDAFRVCHLLVFVQKYVQVEFSLEIMQSSKRETLAWTVGRGIQDSIKIHVELTNGGNVDDWTGNICRVGILVNLINSAIVQTKHHF